MLVVTIRLDVAKNLEDDAFTLAANAYEAFKGKNQVVKMRTTRGTFEVEITDQTVSVRGPVSS